MQIFKEGFIYFNGRISFPHFECFEFGNIEIFCFFSSGLGKKRNQIDAGFDQFM